MKEYCYIEAVIKKRKFKEHIQQCALSLNNNKNVITYDSVDIKHPKTCTDDCDRFVLEHSYDISYIRK